MALWALAALLAMASVALAALHLRGVARQALPDGALIAALKRLPPEQRLEELEQRAPEGSWMRRFAREVTVASGEDARAAAANEVLGEVAHDLEATASWPGAAVRLSCFGAMLVAVTAYLVGNLGAILPVAGIGAGGALISLELGRRARDASAERRRAADALVEATLPDISIRAAARPGTFRRARRQ